MVDKEIVDKEMQFVGGIQRRGEETIYIYGCLFVCHWQSKSGWRYHTQTCVLSVCSPWPLCLFSWPLCVAGAGCGGYDTGKGEYGSFYDREAWQKH
jgi:hypothetical protein